MGDFNIDLLKVNIHAKTNEFVNDIISQGFLPKITRPIIITPHSATLIDHTYSNDNRPTSQNYTSGSSITDVADHFGTFHIANKCKQTPAQKYSQIRQMKTDTARQLAVLKRIGHLLTIKGKLAIFNSFIESNFNYCPLIWHFCSQTNTKKIETIQERALRLI